MKTLFQICVIICVSLAILNVAVNFVQGLTGIFPTSYEEGYVPSGWTNGTFDDITNLSTTTESQTISGIDALFVAVLTGSGLAAIFVAWITRSTAILGVWILSNVFWYSYIRTHLILDLTTYLPNEFIMMGTIAMGFVWAGAVAGMLSGSG